MAADKPSPASLTALARAIVAGDRRALARAITLAESTRGDHRERAEALLDSLLPGTGGARRIGISGSPGVGKSTFIQLFGRFLTGTGRTVAVLAVDPSSKLSGGSILGDKTRMPDLARDPNAFIRPSPAGGTLGGVARRTREAMLLAEAAGYDVVLIETVGVGQSETAVADLVDMFVVLLAPGGGDGLQGIKRGILELADLVIMNKADGAFARAATKAAADYRAALALIRPRSAHWRPEVVLASALEGRGAEEVWDKVEAHHAALAAAGEIARLRAAQARRWMWSELTEGLVEALKSHPAVAAQLADVETAVEAGEMTPGAGARRLRKAFLAADGA